MHQIDRVGKVSEVDGRNVWFAMRLHLAHQCFEHAKLSPYRGPVNVPAAG